MLSALKILPGLALCLAITALAYAIQALEVGAAGHPFVEALVLAILIGTAIRSAWDFGPRWRPGVNFSAKMLLEIAVALLGASISTAAIVAAGPAIFVGIVVVVGLALATSYGLCRLLRLPRTLSLLVACGNSICGNSAIAAVASVVEADGDDVASSIAFTAILGVIVVLGLPLLVPVLRYSQTQYGVLAGLTVYAVPQVLAATIPVGATSVQIGTLVKLVRVLMLGPVVIGVSLLRARRRAPAGGNGPAGARRLSFRRLVPWFILAFLALAVLRALGGVPDAAVAPLGHVATLFTVVAMAALGLGVDLKVVSRVGGSVTLAVTGSLVILLAISVLLIRLLGVA